ARPAQPSAGPARSGGGRPRIAAPSPPQRGPRPPHGGRPEAPRAACARRPALGRPAVAARARAPPTRPGRRSAARGPHPPRGRAPAREGARAAGPGLTATMAELHRRPGVERIALGGLEVAAIEQLVVGLGGGPDSGPLAGVLCDLTAGNAFLVGELWRHLAET